MNNKLPITQKRNEIVNAVKNSDTVIITAETGSGKSTQIPQYLYEAGYEVIVTQPRRIACTTLADRVAEEMEENGKVVAYHTSFESNRTPDTKILFCTDGLQMAKGIKDTVNTVLILDEVHEWNLNIETLVAWIKHFRELGNNKLKVVLMSATIELEELATFYNNATCISIPGRMYDVKKLMAPPYGMVDEAVNYARDKKDILIFVEGKKEINDTIDELKRYNLNAEILPLHGELMYQDQKLCFKKYNRPKIIVSTNIAQTSVTPDVDVVIDNGKEKRIEIINGIEGLYTRNISKADCLQRAGRAGRTKDGIYVLCSYNDLNDRDEFSVPEIQRMSLDKVVLKLASVGINAKDLEFFHQPNKESLNESYSYLNKIGALNKNTITDLGKRIVKLPISVRFGRILIEAEKYHCVEKVIKAVCILECGSMVNFKYKRGDYYSEVSYLDFTSITRSDVLAEIDIYDKIIARKFDNFANGMLNKKMFFRIKELIEKLTNAITNDIDMENNEEPNDLTFIKCLASGMPDCFYRIGYMDCSDANGRLYKRNRNTCTLNWDFAFAIPKTITYKDRWGWDSKMDIITMISVLSRDEVNRLFYDDIIDSDEPVDVQYDAFNKFFIEYYESTLYGVKIGTTEKVISIDNSEYISYLQKYSDLVNAEMKNKVYIGSKMYELSKSIYERKYTVYIDIKDVFATDIKTLTKDGKPVEFNCSLESSYNLEEMRNRLRMKYTKYAIENFKDTLPKIKTGSNKIIIEKLLPELGERKVSIEICNTTETLYVGLKLDGNSCILDIFNNTELCEKSTTETLQAMVQKQVKTEYSDKHFIVKRNGKKMETKQTQSAKEEFHDFCYEIIHDTTKDNFAEQLEFLDEVFKECISQFTEL